MQITDHMAFDTLKTYSLPNGYIIEAFAGSEFIIDEVWHERCYEQDVDITKGMEIIDIGANQGIFALYAAAKGAQVYCFEPNEKNFCQLKKNIEQNGLGEVIHAFKLAIGKDNEVIELLIPDSEHLPFSGLITSKQSVIQALMKKSPTKVISESVNSISLQTVVDTLGSKKIDLLKIDCEGGEFDILKAASKRALANINRIVMETHDAYDEGELYHTVKRLGFGIVNFKKLEGYYPVGYLFADRSKRAVVIPPVAKLRSPPYVFIGEKARFDASESFPTGSLERCLNYRWSVNGKAVNICKDSQCEFSLETIGMHYVQVEVEEDELCDSLATQVMCLPKNYFERPVGVDLPEIGNSIKIMMESGFVFRIKSANIPKLWKVSYIVFYVKVKSSFGSVNAAVQHLSETISLKPGGNKLSFATIDQSTDHIFNFLLDGHAEIKVTWWVE